MKITMRPKGSEAHEIDFGEVKMLSYAYLEEKIEMETFVPVNVLPFALTSNLVVQVKYITMVVVELDCVFQKLWM